MNAVLRKFEPADFEKLLRLYIHFEPKKCYRGLPPMTASGIERWLRRLCGDDRVQFVAEIGMRIVAHAVLQLSPNRTEADLLLFVHQDERGHGLGKRLLLGALQYGCKQLHLDRVLVKVYSANEAAQEELESIGFCIANLNRVFDSEFEMERPSNCVTCRGERCALYGKSLPVSFPVGSSQSQGWVRRTDRLAKGGRP
jgi:RimJ/RimL family protein N-acetyltransferase